MSLSDDEEATAPLLTPPTTTSTLSASTTSSTTSTLTKPPPHTHSPLLHELLHLLRTTLPISSSFALQNLVQALSISLTGRLGTLEIASAAYGYMFATCTGSMIAIGGATALDTLCSQASTHARSKRDPGYVGTFLQRGLLILTLLYLAAIVPLWWNAAPLFRALGQEDDFAELTAVFLRLYIPGGLLQVWGECLKKFLQILGHSDTCTLNILLASVVGLAANHLLIFTAGLGLAGAPIAHTIYQGSVFILLLLYTLRTPSTRVALGPPSATIWRAWPQFCALAGMGILTVASEWWAFEVLALMAARLDADSIATQSILMTSDILFTTISLGLGVACSIRVGALLGAGSPPALLRRAALAPYLSAVLLATPLCAALLTWRATYACLFTTSPTVAAKTARIIPMMAAFQFLDIANGGAAGLLRGAGKVHQAGAANIVGYYAVGLTGAWWMCFRLGWGLGGLWAGIILGSAALLTTQSGFALFIKWDKEVRATSRRVAGHDDGGGGE